MQPGKLSTLRNATIQAMSNLLSANIDSGLMHSIGLGYHKDLQTRAAFIEVCMILVTVCDADLGIFILDVNNNYWK